LFCPPGTPAPPVHPRGNFYQTDFPPLSCSCSLLRGSALLRPHPSGAPAGLTPAGLHPQEVFGALAPSGGRHKQFNCGFASNSPSALRLAGPCARWVVLLFGSLAAVDADTKSSASSFRSPLSAISIFHARSVIDVVVVVALAHLTDSAECTAQPGHPCFRLLRQHQSDKHLWPNQSCGRLRQQTYPGGVLRPHRCRIRVAWASTAVALAWPCE
jgi:hypothetical protein